ncbi:hypothetical protein ACHAPA_011311 [Fusarium lateritium]
MSYLEIARSYASGAKRPMSELCNDERSDNGKRAKLELVKNLETTVMARVDRQYEAAMCRGDAAEYHANFAAASSDRAQESYELAKKVLEEAKQTLIDMEDLKENAQASCQRARKIKEAREAIECRNECRELLAYLEECANETKIKLAELEKEANLLVDEIQIGELESFFEDQIDGPC